MSDRSPDRIPGPLRRSATAALRACARMTGSLPTAEGYDRWLCDIEPLLVLRAYVVDHPGVVPTGPAVDAWLDARGDATAARWSSAKIERAFGSLRRALAAAGRLGPITPEEFRDPWLPSGHTIVSAYGSWRGALQDAGLIEGGS